MLSGLIFLSAASPRAFAKPLSCILGSFSPFYGPWCWLILMAFYLILHKTLSLVNEGASHMKADHEISLNDQWRGWIVSQPYPDRRLAV